MFASCVLAACFTAAPAPAAAPGVAVTVLEGVGADAAWDLSKSTPVETYTEPAFAVTTLPTKYSPRAVPLDRPAPFAVRAEAEVMLPAGEYTFVVRSRGAARLFVGGKQVATLAAPKKGGSGYDPVPPVVKPHDPAAPPLGPGQKEAVAKVTLDGKPCAVRLELLVGDKGRRADAGGTVVTVARAGEPSRILAPVSSIPFTPAGWADYTEAARQRMVKHNADTRQRVSAAERAEWDRRHDEARRAWADKPRSAVSAIPAGGNAVDAFLAAALDKAGVKPTPPTDDPAFLRRVYLDTVGVPPSPEEVAAFYADPASDRRAKVIDRLLADSRWADHWVSYWQDVLAENPGLLKPTLNNTGPFRFWLHQAIADNLPADRFATELVRMDGSKWYGGPAGFAVASENDVPMAAKATILARAFLAADLQCARCHDAPGKGGYKQEQLFAAAALLARKPIKVPATSTVPPGPDGRKPAVRVRLKVGQAVPPAWLLDNLGPGKPGDADPRDRLAAVVTGPANERFPKVMVNRVWARLVGWGLVDPVDNWADPTVHFPELLDHLAHELVASGYDLKHVARLILTSRAYQRQPATAADAPGRFAGPARRRLTAEQLLDSLFAVAGKQFDCGELSFDPEARQAAGHSLNFGVPRRAWELVGLSGERDRPSLALPRAQPLVDLLTAYGWREARAGSLTVREDSLTPVQTMTLANGVVSARIARLSDDGALTALCLEDRSLSELVNRLVLRVLGRAPTAAEEQAITELLADGYDARRVDAPPTPPPPAPRPVSWSHHLQAEASELKLAAERLVRAGDPPTRRLREDWRLRMEDAIWALVNSPEFVFVP